MSKLQQTGMRCLATFWVFCQSFPAVLGDLPLVVVRSERSWEAARAHCRKHYVDLAVADTEAEYDLLLRETDGESGSLWIGLQNSAPGGWRWVDKHELSYDRWYRESRGPRCGSVDMGLAGDRKLLPRLCEEHHAFVCQGASPPDKVEVGAVGTDFVSLRWDRPAFMESVPHSFNISYTSSSGSSSSFISPSNSTLITSLQPGEQYTLWISTVTETVQSLPACVTVTTHLEAPVGVRIDSIYSCVSVSWADPGWGSHTAQCNISYSSLYGHHSGFILTPPFCSHMTITGLLPQTEYMLNITAVNQSGASSLPVTVFLFTSAPAVTVVAMVLRGLQCVFLGLFFWLLCHFHWKRNYDVERTPVETTEEMFFTPQEV